MKKSKPISLSAAESGGDYFVAIKPSARKELDALPDNVLVRVAAKIESLATSPRPAGCKKLKGFKDQWRIRIGDRRVLYIVDDTLGGSA